MILIKGAKIVDGSGQTIPFLADLLIKNDRISAIGKFPSKKADLVIDGLGLYITPGFIDVNTHSDHHLSLFTHPAQSDFLLQGVTTTFGGVCGASLAPLIAGGLEAIRKWTDTAEIKELVRVIAKHGGVYATHLRNDREGLTASVEETVKVAEETGAKVVISHLKPLIGFENDYKKAIELIHQAADIHFDLFPTGESVVPIYTLFPAWARG